MAHHLEYIKILPRSIIYFTLYLIFMFKSLRIDNIFNYVLMMIFTVALCVFVCKNSKRLCCRKLFIAFSSFTVGLTGVIICACISNIIMLGFFNLEFTVKNVEINNMSTEDTVEIESDGLIKNYLNHYGLTSKEIKNIKENPQEYFIVTVTGQLNNSHSYTVRNLRFSYKNEALDLWIQRNPDSYNSYNVLENSSTEMSINMIVKNNWPPDTVLSLLIGEEIIIKGTQCY